VKVSIKRFSENNYNQYRGNTRQTLNPQYCIVTIPWQYWYDNWYIVARNCPSRRKETLFKLFYS